MLYSSVTCVITTKYRKKDTNSFRFRTTKIEFQMCEIVGRTSQNIQLVQYYPVSRFIDLLVRTDKILNYTL